MPYLRGDFPPELAGGVLRLLHVAIDREARQYRAVPAPAMNELLRELYAATVRQAEVSLSETIDDAPSTLEWVTVDQAAWVLGSSAQWVRRLAMSGRLAAHRVGRNWRIDRRALDQYRYERTAS